MQKPMVSVIIPVYNTEAFVEAAVRSITGQTLREIEIVIVNDGSTDNSPTLIGQLASEDERICIHTQPNKGLSEARNAGIARATGRYIYFMDSDDLLESDTLALCYEKSERDGLDLLFFDADTFGADTTDCPWFDYHRAAAYEDRTYTGKELLDTMLGRNKYIASACLYLIRREFVETNQLAFYPSILHEDELFTTQAFLLAKRIGRIDRAFFKRRLRPDSIMGSRFSERNLKGYLTVFRELQRFAAAHDAEMRHLTDRYLRYTLNPVLRNAWALPASIRIRTAGTATRRYFGQIHPSAMAVLLFKKLLKKATGR